MTNGTEKQIAWAKEMKTSLIAQVASVPTGATQLGSDISIEFAKPILISLGTREMDRETRVATKSAKREKIMPMTPADLREVAIEEMGKINDAQWWIENRTQDRCVMAMANRF